MRAPNPPAVMLRALNEEQQRRVIRLALLVVSELSHEELQHDYAALELIEAANMDVEETVAFWSLLDSSQRSVLKSTKENAP